ncbi:MAG TPA: tetratricopeptide repeat protein [Terriglobales bacterium]|nr:tetratricopeptide repeat protein [Terriglobales bacterium]
MSTPRQSWWTARVRAGRARIRAYRRPIYVVWLSLMAAVFFALTFSVNRLYVQRRQQLSSSSFDKGRASLNADRPAEAIGELRTALVYSHDNSQYLFTLAEALEASNRLAEAKSYFLNLLEDQPGSGPVNLQLARLAEKENEPDNAIRYFNGAIYGAWEDDPVTKRQQVRQEFINFLISKDLKTQARGELLTYTAEMPKNGNAQLWVAQAFSRIGDDRSALDFYRIAVRANRRDITALLGAGRAAFHMGRFRNALEYFKGADEIHDDPATEQLIQLVTLVIDSNPFESRIDTKERRQRLLLAMDVADHRLRQCAEAQNIDLTTIGMNPLQVARARWVYLDGQIRRARTGADLVQLLAPVASLVTTVEQQDPCGLPSAEDQAMLRIYQNAEDLQQ